MTRAAEELGRTHGAVSRQLRSLQEQAGLPLFDKAGTGLALNQHGAALQEVVAGALDDLEQGWLRVLHEAHGPSLHVACSATFAMRWLVPHLAGFYRLHPEVRVRLSMTSARDIRHQGADLVLAWDRLSYPARDQARAIRIGSIAFGPVCAPGYPVARDGSRLTYATRIAHDFTTRAWTDWEQESGLTVAHEAELRFPHTHLCIEAALAGLGVALVEQRMVRDDLATARLVAPCGFLPFEDGLAVVPASERAMSRAAQAFLAWITTELAAQRV
ncbi:LysR substrate-binding domain-containing protein [Bosea sp. 685]|uniref:LysR substrate-binding domain-containing protein n=1 Tax=Bosea sp. 685 TaxID=3080057 RepID=UPI002892FA50|nr:LysR substrate-binding domain-containing protein [Bosea sp. 685]WNJ92823.1 LysR substrate-binding domain-containing protein [Bosea sp. 685]